MYSLTPRRKSLGKAVAQRSKKAIVADCWGDPEVRKNIMKIVCKEVVREMKCLTSSQCLRVQVT